MDSLNYSSPFSSLNANIDSWGNVTNNFGHNLGYISRYSPDLYQGNNNSNSLNIDSFGSVSNGFNGCATPFLQLNGYDSFRSNCHMQLANDYEQLSKSREQQFSSFDFNKEIESNKFRSYEPVYIKPPKIELNIELSSFSSFRPKKNNRDWEFNSFNSHKEIEIYKIPEIDPFYNHSPKKEYNFGFPSIAPINKFNSLCCMDDLSFNKKDWWTIL